MRTVFEKQGVQPGAVVEFGLGPGTYSVELWSDLPTDVARGRLVWWSSGTPPPREVQSLPICCCGNPSVSARELNFTEPKELKYYHQADSAPATLYVFGV